MNWVSAQMMARIASPYRPSDTQRIEMHWVTMISPPMSGHLSNRVQARMVRKSAKTVQLALGLAAATLQCFLSVAGAQDLAIITLAGQKQMLANPGTDPAGARNPDVTIVEYFDYNCPYCKKLAPVLQTLLAQDPKIAVICGDRGGLAGKISRCPRCVDKRSPSVARRAGGRNFADRGCEYRCP